MSDERKALGQIAYEAYVEKFPGQARELAFTWSNLNPALRTAWQAAAVAVVHQVARGQRE